MKKRMLRGVLAVAIVISILAGAWCMPAAAAEQHSTWPEMIGVLSARYTVHGGQVTRLEVGDTFQLEFWMNGIDPYAITIPVNWDPTVVTMVNDSTGRVVSSGLKTEAQMGDGFRAGSACYDFSYDDNWEPLYWNGNLVFSKQAATSDGYPYIDNENGHCHIFFYVGAPTPSAVPQMFLSLTFKVLRQGDPNFHFATDADAVYDPAATEGMMMAFKDQGVVVSRMQLPAVYVISSWSDSTPLPDDPGIGTPGNINGDPDLPEESGSSAGSGGSGFGGDGGPIFVSGPTIRLINATHGSCYPYKTPIKTQAVIRCGPEGATQADNYILPASYLAVAINKVLNAPQSYSAILAQMPDEIIEKDEYIVSFSCRNLDDLVDQVPAMLYFETPYGYVGVNCAALLAQVGDKANVTLGVWPAEGGLELTVEVDGEAVDGFSGPVFLLILPCGELEYPRVVSADVFGPDADCGALPLSICHYYPETRSVSFLAASAGTYVLEPATAQSFADVPESHWAYAAVSSLSAAGIVNGKGEDSYAPDGLVTRAELAKLITCTLATYQTVHSTRFADVDSGAWYAPYVGSAYRIGIVMGRTDSQFAPAENVTRQDLAVMAYRGLTALGVTLPELRTAPDFADQDSIADYAADAVTALYRAGILNGMGNGCFDPGGTATRAQAAQIISGMYALVKNLV